MKSLILVLTCLSLPLPCSAATIIVDPNGSGDFITIQEAINNSKNGDTVELCVGTYGSPDDNIYFNCKSITLTSSDPNDPNVTASTIINSDIHFLCGEGPSSIITGLKLRRVYCTSSSPTISKNTIGAVIGSSGAYPTLTHNTIGSNPVGGRAVSDCDGTISHNTITGNYLGGLQGCDGLIADNILSGNHATLVSGGNGAALHSCNGVITRNTIVGNTADDRGGALYECNGEISHNVISGNYAGVYGGGLAFCDALIKNNLISGNVAGESGGGLSYCSNNSITNNTVVGNLSMFEGGEGYSCHNCELRNNIFASNRSAGRSGAITSNSNSTYSCFYDNVSRIDGVDVPPGIGNLALDPLFTHSGHWDTNDTPDDYTDDVWTEGDYHLKSQSGRWDPNSGTWVLDDVNSPCIDAGDPCDPIGVEPNPNGGRINIGAYGGTAEASKSPSGIVQPVCTKYPTMDFNEDCRVDIQDFAIFTQGWLDCNLDPPEACWQ